MKSCAFSAGCALPLPDAPVDHDVIAILLSKGRLAHIKQMQSGSFVFRA
ncbi:Unknown protein sequence [Pseudomonas amygdali pv. myricae]|nr:Unknown protein sequence [Pseudomonas amygdali pv. myricae]